ncbi:lysosomal alpha-mannosidase II isoform X1 [Nomia melanderi]|uniref:lysosomal alpha-mannosidase II isoform X1 n=1 Tax=Nomia melanderi TaxID=2448451 RepID=UPI0013041324|nr:lysosomal alpha-mannosidase-like isoform X1 [Nomia melanderi]
MSRLEFFLTLLLLPLLFSHGEAASIRERATAKKCGYEACPVTDPKKLNIHLVAHTHDDVGWLKTVDQYYFGSRPRIQKAGVQYILDSAIEALLTNPERKFMYVETAFLWKWWLRQNNETQQNVRNLINEGRLEIIGGGWSMNDEAVTHYHSLIDQYSWGFRRLKDVFGSCARPHIGWQIDPFGHSREQASLFAQLGFDGMFFGRLDYQDKAKRLKDKTMEFIWKGSPSLGADADLFTVALYNNYSPPPGFCFDVLCNDEPINDDPKSPDYNVDERVEKLLEYARRQASSYRSNNVIFTMGEDFNYQHAEMWFTNLDRLIRYVRERNSSEVNIFYSTPSCYLKAVHDANLQWPTKTDDFFPYASDPHSYWTGYFSSRPAIKFYERMGNNLLQISKQLTVLAGLTNRHEELDYFREAMGIMQHHDAVTGTEKQLVAEDYARILYNGMANGANINSAAIRQLMNQASPNKSRTAAEMYSCMQLNVSSCPYTEDKDSILTIYNPLSYPIDTPVRIPIEEDTTYKVVNLVDSSEVVSQVVPIHKPVQNIPGRISKAKNELVFIAKVPAMGHKSYKVVKGIGSTRQQTYGDVPRLIGNEFYNIYIDQSGQVVVNWTQPKNMNFVQSFHYYEGMEGNNEESRNRSSGAYIFRPKQISAKNFGKPAEWTVHIGPVVEELHQTINDWVSQVIRVYRGKEYVEFDWLVGPIPVQDKIGKEIVTKYSSSLKTAKEFYTDSNGREMLKRKRDYRPTWKLQLEEEVAGNYYPVTSKISLVDKKKSFRLSALTDRAQGGTSMQDGEIELMIHRRLLKDDAFGVGEALNETAFGEGLVVRGSHYLIGGSIKNLDEYMLKEKSLQLETLLRPWTLVTPIAENATVEELVPLPEASGLAKALPRNVHILTLEPWTYNIILLRLEHIFEVGESETLSQPVEVNLRDVFTNYNIVTVEETSLGANQWKADMNRLKWQAETNDVLQSRDATSNTVQVEDDAINITLKPMEIRTFLITMLPRKL